MQICILGMHRSGTSAVTRVINLMGAYLGTENVLMPPGMVDNPKGYWERGDVVGLNDAVLRKLGSAWDRISSFDLDALDKETGEFFRSRAIKIIGGMDAHRPWVMKDPRNCLLFPLWKKILEVPVAIIVFREPLAIAESLKKRDGFPMRFGLALWEAYNIHALKACAGLPHRFVSFEELVERPVEEVKAIRKWLMDNGADRLRMPTKREIEAFIDAGRVHFHGDPAARDKMLSSSQSKLWGALKRKRIPKDIAGWELSSSSLEVLRAQESLMAKKEEDEKRALALKTEEAEKAKAAVAGIGARLYIDVGSGFDESLTAEPRTPVAETSRKAVFNLSAFEEVRAIRFDPASKMVALRLSKITLHDDDGCRHPCEGFTHNAEMQDGDLLIFLTKDPQILLSTPAVSRPKKLEIELKYLATGDQVWPLLKERLSRKVKDLNLELDRRARSEENLRLELDLKARDAKHIKQALDRASRNEEIRIAAEAELGDMIKLLAAENKDRESEIARLREEVASVRKSMSWRLTAPLRLLGLALRGLFGWLFEKPIKSAFLAVYYKFWYRLKGKKTVELIRKSGLFDGSFYARANPGVARSGVGLVAHYIRRGATLGLDPHPLFDTSFYLESYPDVAKAGINPLAHFIATGAAEGRNPNPLFDTFYYLEENPDVAEFDINPLLHFIKHGQAEGRRPHPLFFTDYYLEQYPDVAEAGVGALIHFLLTDPAEGRNPNPLFDTFHYLEENPEIAETGTNPLVHFISEGAARRRDPNLLFDVSYYLGRNPDVKKAGINPLEHYFRSGAQEGRKTTYLFDTSYYLENNLNVAEAGINPLVHFLTTGHAEGRDPHPLFDSSYYLEQNPDVAEAGVNPLCHFLKTGAAEGRSPHPLFDVSYYLERNPDVAEAGANPLVHYLVSGAAEGRRPNKTVDPEAILAAYPEFAYSETNILIQYALVFRQEEAPDLPPAKIGVYESWLEVNAPNPNRTRSLLRGVNDPSLIPVVVPFEYQDGSAGLKEFERELSDVDCVSFDLFDTLVERVTACPTDIFKLVEAAAPFDFAGKSFARERISAESEARKESRHQEVNLDEIYTFLARRLDLDSEQLSSLKATEIDLEFKHIVPKAGGMQLLDIALSLGKTILLLTDIYLDQAFIKAVLKKCGIENYAGLYISSQLRKTKHHGSLFEQILDDTKLNPDRILHVGDNEHSDARVPSRMGIKVWTVRKSIDLFLDDKTSRETTPGGKEGIADLDIAKTTSVGLVANRLAANRARPRRLSIFPGDPFSIGYSTLGPLLLGFTLGVSRWAAEERYDKLFFASRDGYYMKMAYDLLRGYETRLPESHYFVSSRMLSYAASLRSDEDIANVARKDYYPTPLKNILKHRFLFDDEECSAIPDEILDRCGFRAITDLVNQRTDGNKIINFLGHFASEILGKAETIRDDYTSYLSNIGLSDDSTAIVDIGYAGTAQKIITELLGPKIGGYYFITSPYARQLDEAGLEYRSFWGRNARHDRAFFDHVRLFEIFFSATHPSVIRVKKKRDGEYEFDYSNNMFDQYSVAMLSALHKGAISYVEDYLQHHNEMLGRIDLDWETVKQPILNFFESPGPENSLLFSQMVFEDNFGGDYGKLVMSSRDLHGRGKEEVIAAGSWKEGSLALFEKPDLSEHFDPRGIDVLFDFADAEPVTRYPIHHYLVDTFEGNDLHPSFEDDLYDLVFGVDDGWHETPGPIRPGDQTSRGKTISLILPLTEPDRASAELVLDSVMQQSYPHWELAIAASRSGESSWLEEFVNNAVDQGNRISFHLHENAEEQSLAAEAIEGAQGEWLILLDQNCILEKDALMEFVNAFENNADARLVYCDEDIIENDGVRKAPHFKPEFSPELLLCRNYFGNVYALKRELLDGAGGVSHDSKTAWRHDLVLRATAINSAALHIPRVLFHSIESESIFEEDRNAGSNDGCRVVQKALSRRQMKGKAEIPAWSAQHGPEVFSVRFPDVGPSVAILIPTRNNLEPLRQCLDSLEKTTYNNYKVYILDNESDDPDTVEYISRCGHKVFRIPNREGGFSFSYINNRAAELVDEEYLLMLNDDTVVINPSWLSQMVGWGQVEGVGSVGARLLFANETVQHAGIVNRLQYHALPAPAFKLIPSTDPGYQGYALTTRNCSAVTAACMLTPRMLFLKMNGFDDKDFSVAYNDCDYGFRLVKEGYRNVYCPEALLYHNEGTSRGTGVGNDKPAEEATCVVKWADWEDPYYSPNLASGCTDFSISSRACATGSVPKLRVIMVTHNLHFEGAPLIQYEIAKGLKETGRFEPVIVSPSEGKLRAEYEALDIEVHLLEFTLFQAANIKEYRRRIGHLADTLANLKPDVIFANTVLSFWAVDGAANLRIPSIWVIHESEPPFTHLIEHGPVCTSAGKRCLAFPYKVVFTAEATRRIFEPHKTRHNYRVVHNGFDPARLEEQTGQIAREQARKDLGLGPDEICVFMPGVFCLRKRQGDLLEAAAKLDSRTLQRTKFFLVGDRPSHYSSNLHNRFSELPKEVRERIHLVPETKEIGIYYKAADLFICASKIESFPKVIQEAMYFSLPIITTPVFGISEQVHDNVSALFFEPGNADQLSDRIKCLADSPELRETLGSNAKVSLDKLPSLSRWLSEYASLFSEAWLSGQTRSASTPSSPPRVKRTSYEGSGTHTAIGTQ